MPASHCLHLHQTRHRWGGDARVGRVNLLSHLPHCQQCGDEHGDNKDVKTASSFPRMRDQLSSESLTTVPVPRLQASSHSRSSCAVCCWSHCKQLDNSDTAPRRRHIAPKAYVASLLATIMSSAGRYRDPYMTPVYPAGGHADYGYNRNQSYHQPNPTLQYQSQPQPQMFDGLRADQRVDGFMRQQQGGYRPPPEQVIVQPKAQPHRQQTQSDNYSPNDDACSCCVSSPPDPNNKVKDTSNKDQ